MSLGKLLLGLGLVATLSQEGFQILREDKGVKVYARNHRHAIELGAEGFIDAPPSVVRAVLLDYTSHPRWVQGLAESRILRRGADSLEVYQRLKLPIIDDRDFTIHVSWGDDGGVEWLKFSTANGGGPKPIDGVVRVRLNEGGWRLHGVDGDKATFAVYKFTLDLGGSLPPWLGRGRAGKDIVKLFERIRDQTRYYR
jgi:hypothetical protein